MNYLPQFPRISHISSEAIWLFSRPHESFSSSGKQHSPPLSGWPEVMAVVLTGTGDSVYLESQEIVLTLNWSVHSWVFKDYTNSHGQLRGFFTFVRFALGREGRNATEGSLNLNSAVTGETTKIMETGWWKTSFALELQLFRMNLYQSWSLPVAWVAA